MARDFVGFFRSFSEPTLRDGLRLGTDDIGELCQRLTTQITADADRFDFTVHIGAVVLART